MPDVVLSIINIIQQEQNEIPANEHSAFNIKLASDSVMQMIAHLSATRAFIDHTCIFIHILESKHMFVYGQVNNGLRFSQSSLSLWLQNVLNK